PSSKEGRTLSADHACCICYRRLSNLALEGIELDGAAAQPAREFDDLRGPAHSPRRLAVPDREEHVAVLDDVAAGIEKGARRGVAQPARSADARPHRLRRRTGRRKRWPPSAPAAPSKGRAPGWAPPARPIPPYKARVPAAAACRWHPRGTWP